MTINERVSPKRLAEIIARAEVCDDSVLTDYRDIESIARELQQYRAAAEPVCPKCRGTGMADSGGFQPWGEPILIECDCHVAPQLPQPAPVAVPDEMEMDDDFDSAFEHGKAVGWNACRAAMLTAAPAVQAEQLSGNTEQVSQPYTLTFDRWLSQQAGEIDVDCGCVTTEAFFHWLRVAYEAGNSPAIPEGYALVPSKLTAENGAKGALSGEFSETKFISCPECFGDDECETCDGSGRIEITVPVSWTSIKEIWAKGVEHFAAAPKQDFREIPNSSTNNCRENAETSTKCWCHACRPVTMTDMRFVVCPECGNKRCPHANDHRNPCTGSNEPGQEGSAYPDAPKQEAE